MIGPRLERLRRSLTVRVAGAALLAIAVFAASTGVVTMAWVERLLRREVHQRGAALGGGLAATVTDAIATGDTVGLHLALREAAAAHPHVRYVVVIDGRGALQGHSFAVHPSQAFVAALSGQRPWRGSLVFDTELGRIHDVAVPARGPGGLGVHVGMADEMVAEALAPLTVLFAAAGVTGLLASLLVALHVSQRTTRPLREMAAAARATAQAVRDTSGTDALPTTPALAPTGLDEVDGLATSVQELAAAVRSSRARLHDAQRHLVRTERMAALGAFVAGTAHAINNPLGGVRACIEMIQQSPGDAGRLRRYGQLADEGLQRIHGLVARLQQFVRGGGSVRVPVDLGELVAASLVVEQPVSRKGYGAALELEPAAGPMRVVGDPAELEQALTNLVINALQATPQGGVVKVRVFRPEPGWIEARVDDAGPGVAPELAQKVFEPFFTTKPEGEGTGLGLWVAWGVAERHGGVIEVGRSPQGGARFILRLPAAGGGDDA